MKKKRRRSRFNFKLIGLILSLLIAIGVGVFGIHRYQVRRRAGALVDEARSLEKAGKFAEAAEAWHRFLLVKPDNPEVRAIYASLIDKTATNPKEKVIALEEIEGVLRVDPDRTTLRRRALALAMELAPIGGAKYDDARRHIDALIKESQDAGLLDLQGQTFEAEGKFDEAQKSYRTALTINQKATETSLRLATMLIDKEKNVSDATKILDDMVKADPNSAKCYLKRSEFRVRNGIPGSEDDVIRARELAPDDADVIVAGLAADLPTKSEDDVLAEIRRGLKLHPKDIRFYRLLVTRDIKAKRLPEAIDALRGALDKAIPEKPDERQNQIELRLMLADLLQGSGKSEEANAIIADLRKVKDITPDMTAVLDYLDAKNLIIKNEWVAAVAKLKDVVPRLRNVSELQTRAYVALGSSCSQIGDNEGRGDAFREAGKVSPDHPVWTASHLELAGALLALGRPEEALAEYQAVVGKEPGASVIIANLLLNRVLTSPPAKRNWAPVEKAVNEAAKLVPNAPEIPLIRATMLMAKGQNPEARALLEAARSSDRIEPWVALCTLAGREGRFKDFEALLAEMRKKFGDRVEVRLAAARLLTDRDRGAAAPRLKEVLTDNPAFDEERKLALYTGVVEAYFRINALKEAQELWDRLVKAQPDKLNLWTTAFDLAGANNDEAAMQTALDNIHRIEGSGGTLGNLGEVFVMVRQKKQGKAVSLATARSLMADILTKRPNSSRVVLAQAELDSLEGNSADAANHYLKAIDLGDKSPLVFRKAVSLLYQQNRFTEADNLVRGLADAGTLPDDLKPMASELASRNQDYARALELARQPVAAGSKNPADYIWLGQLLHGSARQAEAKNKADEARGNNAEAERNFRKALTFPGDANPARVALIQFLAVSNPNEKGEAALRDYQKQAPDLVDPMTLAVCHQALGHFDEARARFKALLAAMPDNPSFLRTAATLELKQGRFRDAEPLLTRLSGLKTVALKDAEWARQALGISLAAVGRYKDSERALKVLGITVAGDDPTRTVEDRRTNAKVLALQTNPAMREKAVEILEHLIAEKSANDSDRFVLAQLYDVRGDWSRAREMMLSVFAADRPEPEHLAYFADRLLDRNEIDAAAAVIDSLAKREPGQFRTVVLKARLVSAQGKKRDAVLLVETFLKQSGGPKETAFAAALFDQLLLPVPAEKLYRQLAENPGDSQSVLALAGFLGRQGRLDETIKICTAATGKIPAQDVSATLLKILFTSKPNDKQVQSVEALLKQAIDREPAKSAIKFDLANFYILSKRYKEAEAIYRKHCETAAPDSLALNNLAWLITLHGGGGGGGGEALDFIDRAIKLDGKRPELLDTRGLVYIGMNKYEEARNDLTESTANMPRPETYLHLAKVCLKLSDRKAASEAFAKAKSTGLQRETLDAADQALLDDLLKELVRN